MPRVTENISDAEDIASSLTEFTQDSLNPALEPFGNLTEAFYLDQNQTRKEIASGGSVNKTLDVVDAIQPFIVRASLGDCVKLDTVNLLPKPIGIHIHGLRTEAGQGMAIGDNSIKFAAPGETDEAIAYIPNHPSMEGAHFLHSHADERFQTKHGMFGALVAEPQEYKWKEQGDSSADANSGQSVMITDEELLGTISEDKPDYREYVVMYHDEVGLVDAQLGTKPVVSPYGEYGPGQKAINLRSEPFMNRFMQMERTFGDGGDTFGGEGKYDKSQGYGSYTYGDPATFVPEAYVGDPVKMRLLNAGPGQDHVHHLHGGGIRWRLSPVAADSTNFTDGLEKDPEIKRADSERVDVQRMSPGESFNAEIEGGAGGVQQSVGDFLMHCHIVEHYVSGMWTFWRVYNTRQSHLDNLPDQEMPSWAVNSRDLVGTTLPNGTQLTTDNVDDWVEKQLPAQGNASTGDASVWNWAVEEGEDSLVADEGPLYLGEPETNRTWPNYGPDDRLTRHTSETDQEALAPGERPEIMFNPDNGRLAFPTLRPHLGDRPPFAPEHGPSPYLNKTTANDNHSKDGLCPEEQANVRKIDYNITAFETESKYDDTHADDGKSGPAQIYAHTEHMDEIRTGERPAKSLVLRGNVGDCIDITLTNNLDEPELDSPRSGKMSKVNMHTHLIQFDVQASDGVITGLNWEQSVRPADTTGTSLIEDATTGDTSVTVDDVSPFVDEEGDVKKDARFGIGLTESGME